MNDAVGKAALERALDEKEDLVLLYQPIHDARSGAIYSAEALLRQRRESGELREASIIHEAAEESCGSELFRLDHFLMRQALTGAASWHHIAPAVRLNINLSPREFEEANILPRLDQAIEVCGIDRSRINVELTETSYIEEPERTMNVLAELKRCGLGLWLDDFGTGHSSLTHLQHFPVDGVKLAGAFIRPLPDDRRCRAIVRALLSLAHDLGIAVTAEEVERQEQLDFLLEHGCEYIQGFLFNKPLSIGDFQATLAGNSSPGQ